MTLILKNSEYRDLYDRYSEEKGIEIDQRANMRKEMKNNREYDDFDNQSDVSCITTQSSAQLLGELESMDVPIIQNTLKLNKGIQTDHSKEEEKESKSNFEKDKSQQSTSTTSSSAHNVFVSELDNKIISKYEKFWSEKLKDEFEELNISDVEEMHKIMLNMKKIFQNIPRQEAEPLIEGNESPNTNLEGNTQNNELYDIFADKKEQKEEVREKLADGLEDLDDLFG